MTLSLFSLLMALVAAGVLAWQVQRSLQPAWRRYRASYVQDASAGLREVFLFMNPAQLWLMAMLSAVFLMLTMLALQLPWLVAVVSGALAWQWPARLLQGLRRRRQQLLAAQLPAALMNLAAALRAGASVPAALRQLADLAQAPLSQELGLVLREQRVGLSLDEALKRLEQRAGVPSLLLMTAAFRIAGGAGGNLAGTLEGLSETVRSQLQVQGRMRALTSQGRMQAWVLSALPLVLALVLYLLRPEQMTMLWSSPPGWVALALMAVLQMAGWFWIRRILEPRS